MQGIERQKPLIFISHSAKDDGARKVLRKLYKVLSKDYEVLLDKERLRPNDKWRDELHAWMALCQGAVLLLSEDAVCRSPWVKKEATFLSIRRDDDVDFPLIPVLLKGVTSDSLKGGDFGPLRLDDLQAIQSDSPDVIAAEVSEQFEPLRERAGEKTPLREVEEQIERILFDVLERGRGYPQPLSDAASLLGQRLKWRAGKTYSEQVARALLGADLEKTTKFISKLAPSFRTKEVELESLLDLLVPLWVPPDALSTLPRMNERPRRQRAVCVNGVEHPFTAECYLLRARAGSIPWIAAPVNLKKGHQEVPPDKLLDVIKKSIMRQLAFQTGVKDSREFDGEDEEFDEEGVNYELQQREESGEPLFILVPRKFNDELLRPLRDHFETFTFFLLHDEETPDETALGDKHILLLKPLLPPGQDRQFRSLVRRARSDIRGTQKKPSP